jgi:L-ascorbate metabolism protein UlaG (beta-lactamase superfamily)
MRIRRLGWAGLEITTASGTAVVDAIEQIGLMERLIGAPHEPLPPAEAAGRVDVALVTHLHGDHTDAGAIARALGPDGLVLRPAPADGDGLEIAATAEAEAALATAGLHTQVVAPWESVEAAGLRLTAVPAADGFGDPQISWVVEGDGRRILHAGDTVFHGHWWAIAMRHGPFDAVFLPVNGPVTDLPHRQPPSPLPVAMDPRQAAVAAHLLRAALAVPIHYGALHREPVYVQVDDPAGTFLAEAAALGVEARVLGVGETLELPVS